MKFRERILVWLLGNRTINEVASESRLKTSSVERVAFLTCVDELRRLTEKAALNEAFRNSINDRLRSFEKELQQLRYDCRPSI